MQFSDDLHLSHPSVFTNYHSKLFPFLLREEALPQHVGVQLVCRIIYASQLKHQSCTIECRLTAIDKISDLLIRHSRALRGSQRRLLL